MFKIKLNEFVEDICTYNNFSQEKTEEIQYAMTTIIYEILKITIIISLFSILGYFKEVLLFMGVMVLVKPFTGGYHEPSQIRCLIATIILCSFILVISANSSLNLICTLFLSLVNIFSVYHQAPIVNQRMPISKFELIKKNKIIALVSYIVLSIISILIIKNGVHSNIITWTLTINVCLMFNSNKGV